jgi:hypothetical protein
MIDSVHCCDMFARPCCRFGLLVMPAVVHSVHTLEVCAGLEQQIINTETINDIQPVLQLWRRVSPRPHLFSPYSIKTGATQAARAAHLAELQLVRRASSVATERSEAAKHGARRRSAPYRARSCCSCAPVASRQYADRTLLRVRYIQAQSCVDHATIYSHALLIAASGARALATTGTIATVSCAALRDTWRWRGRWARFGLRRADLRDGRAPIAD